MSQLQEFILREGLATVNELNRAIFSFPDSSILEAFEQTFGEARASAMREAIAKHLRITVLKDEEVRFGIKLGDIRAIDFIPLVQKFKCIPLAWKEDGDNRQLLLAVSDPFSIEAEEAFKALFHTPITILLAREKAILDAFAFTAAELSLAARTEVSEPAELNTSGVIRHLEDPEVRKAIQQLVATAVKHNAALVEVDPNLPFTRALFSFVDGMSSTVEISVSPLSVLASLVRRGQVKVQDSRRVSFECRIRFKSVSVNFELECINFTSEGPSSDRRLNIKQFSIDNPDNPCFWSGLYDANGALLREIFDQPNGVYFLLSQRTASAEFASKAILESYPDTGLAEVSLPLVEAHPLWAQAQDQRMLAVLRGGDAFDLLSSVPTLSSKNKALLRGVFCYHQLARICVFCSTSEVPSTETLLKVSSSFPLVGKNFRKGTGCQICDGRGVLGFVGISSVFDFHGYAGKLICSRNNAAVNYFDALARDCFVPVFVDGLRSSGAGQVLLQTILSELPKPPPEYLKKREVIKSQLESEDEETLELKLEDEVLESKSSSGNTLGEGREVFRPIRGPDAFFSRPEDLKLKDEPTVGAVGVVRSVRSKPSPEVEPLSEKGQTLLVIDDDPDQRAILRRVFEIAGYQVEVAADGIDGIVSAARLCPSVIIVDFMMPELDGRETIRRLKHGPATRMIPVVALTAYADPDVELGLLQAGADDFCPKSVSKQVLLKRVERLIESHRGRNV